MIVYLQTANVVKETTLFLLNCEIFLPKLQFLNYSSVILLLQGSASFCVLSRIWNQTHVEISAGNSWEKLYSIDPLPGFEPICLISIL